MCKKVLLRVTPGTPGNSRGHMGAEFEATSISSDKIPGAVTIKMSDFLCSLASQ
jgi:hypothetical protein